MYLFISYTTCSTSFTNISAPIPQQASYSSLLPNDQVVRHIDHDVAGVRPHDEFNLEMRATLPSVMKLQPTLSFLMPIQ